VAEASLPFPDWVRLWGVDSEWWSLEAAHRLAVLLTVAALLLCHRLSSVWYVAHCWTLGHLELLNLPFQILDLLSDWLGLLGALVCLRLWPGPGPCLAA